jgi:UDP-2-acetamido-2,6-beta-L-arabino-hexul-4-ose reductase
VLTFVRGKMSPLCNKLLAQADAVVHLAGENRPADVQAFAGQHRFDRAHLPRPYAKQGKTVPLILASSSPGRTGQPLWPQQAGRRAGVANPGPVTGNPVAVLPFAWRVWQMVQAQLQLGGGHVLPQQSAGFARADQRPNAHTCAGVCGRCGQLPCWRQLASGCQQAWRAPGVVAPEYRLRLGELSDQIDAFKNCRSTLSLSAWARAGDPALYATYVSYLPVEKFAYNVPQHGDAAWRVCGDAQNARCRASSAFSRHTPASPVAGITTTPRPKSFWSSKARRALVFGIC